MMRAHLSTQGSKTALAWLLTIVFALSPVSVVFAGSDEKDNTEKKAPARVEDSKADPKPASADKVDKADMTKVVEAMEERIRVLEAKLAALTEEKAKPAAAPAAPAAIGTATATAAASPAPQSADVAKDVQSIKDDAKKDTDLFAGFFRNVEVSGLVDGYYSFNNNKVDLFTQGRAFDVRHNAFSLQMAKIAFERKNSKDSPLGFRVELGVGETTDRIISVSDSSRNDATKHLLQGYVSYVAPVGKNGLTLDFGKFYTPVGAEVVDTKDNFNYTRGWLFTYGPYYHTGLRAKYAFNDKVALTGFLVNGWDNLFENNVGPKNAGKTVGFQLGLNPTKKFSLTETYLAGPEAPLANVPDISKVNNWRHVFDTVAAYNVNDKLSLLGNVVYGSDGDNNAKRGSWAGFAGYFKYQFNKYAAFSPRFEVFNDADGLRTGLAQTVKDITLTQELKRGSYFTRFEYRRDFSDKKFFTNSIGAPRDNQNTFTVGIGYSFTTREP